MNLWITDDVMTSDVTAHTARPVAGGWELSWLPGLVLERNQAVSGMVLAETAAEGTDQQRGPLLRVLAAELGLTGEEALQHLTSDTTEDAHADAEAAWIPADASEAADDGSVDER
jgi:hypothetical protein